MEWDIDKLGTFLEKSAREGVAIERRIYEWKLAEQKLQVAREAHAEQPEVESLRSKVG